MWVIHSVHTTPTEEHLACAGVRYLALDGKKLLPHEILERLYQEGIQSLLIEGGGQTLQEFIDAGCYDDMYIEVAPQILGVGRKAPHLPIL